MGLMTLHLEIWRQKNKSAKGGFVVYPLSEVSPDMSFLEMLDHLNESLIKKGEDPVEFDSDCREGICGTCGFVINGQAHGPLLATTTCELYMRHFQDGDTIIIEPWRAKSHPVIKDLVVDKSALDRVIAAGGYITTRSGPHPDGNAHLIPKPIADRAMDAASCIACGHVWLLCPNASASLFTAAKIAHLNVLPQGQADKNRRVFRMVRQMDLEGYGNCTNIGECRAACPKEISLDYIALMRKDYLAGLVQGEELR